MKLKRSTVRLLMAGLKALDGRQELARDNDGKTLGLITLPYDLGVKARYAAAKTIAKIQDEVDACNTACNAMVAGSRVKFDDVANDPNIEKEISVFLAESVEVEVFCCQVSEFKIDTNKLPPSVIAAIMPILEGDV